MSRDAPVTYDEHAYPARPRALRPRARLRGQVDVGATVRDGDPVGTNPFYVAWLTQQSMLHDAATLAAQFSGSGSMWQNPYARPDPAGAVAQADVWFTAYPPALVTDGADSYLATLARDDLWEAFAAVGVRAVHTGPVKLAGGISGWDRTPSVDGHFDRVSTHIDPVFGTEAEFRRMCEAATRHGGLVIDDIVPGHTGKGADFRLAEMGVGDYPGIFHMVEIAPEDWPVLPQVPPGRDAANLDAATEARLADAGYIVGPLQRVIFYDPGVKETNWSATGPVVGPDGVARRWVYLHYFKEGQPSVNWLDPTFAGMRMVIGDALHSLGDLGSGALRLDANGFLGVEKAAEGMPAWSEGHPLSDAANQLIASMVRKVGGFTFQELNLSVDDIAETSVAGADLSYDFVTRPAYHHALATGDTEFLRLTLAVAREAGVPAGSLVHALQNHDELTYELVHFASTHADDTFAFRGATPTGVEIAETVRAELTHALTGDRGPYNALFTTNGISCTTVSVVTAALGLADLDALDEHDVERVVRAHLLLARYNAWQPGVFAVSGWDLCGILPVAREAVAHLMADGDTRWLHRGAYDLLGLGGSDASSSFAGMPRGRSLYGSLPSQLATPGSFVDRLRQVIAVRRRSGVAVAELVDVPPVAHPAMLVLVSDPGRGRRLVTVLNFGDLEVAGAVASDHLPAGATVSDVEDGRVLGTVDGLGSFGLGLGAHEGRLLAVEPAG